MLETCRANINTTTYTGCTPLHIASGRGDITLTAYLLSMGANPDLVTDEGDTALDLSGSDQVGEQYTVKGRENAWVGWGCDMDRDQW